MKKEYILVGSNNFWYALCTSLKEARNRKKEILDGETGYADPETGHTPEIPEEVYVYQVKEIK